MTMQHSSSDNTPSSERENVGASAAGGAALGAVIALGIISTSVVSPLVGAAGGAALGAGIGYFINTIKKRHTLPGGGRTRL